MITLDTEIAGETMRLDHRRALVWPRQRWLLIADLHLGKASLMRQSGAALPRGTTTSDLARLSALIAEHTPQRLLVLGDLVHGNEQKEADWLATLARWRNAHPTLELTLIAGNHDRHMSLHALGFDVLTHLDAEPFHLAHVPGTHATLHVLAGHLHPAATLRDARLRHRLPAFWIGPQRTVLPAFGALTGLAPIAAAANDRVYALTPGGVLALGTRGHR
ncbi:MAG: ligase-associated DNA damage response endonuclease PdeM [Dokdonella sp.]